MIGYHKEKDIALGELGENFAWIVEWLKDFGLKVNEKKTEVCSMHRNKNTDGTLKIDNTTIPSKIEMNSSLGIYELWCNVGGVLLYW